MLVADWKKKMREAIEEEAPEETGRAKETPLSRLADEVARAGTDPREVLRIVEALDAVAKSLMEDKTLSRKEAFYRTARLNLVAEYVPRVRIRLTRVR